MRMSAEFEECEANGIPFFFSFAPLPPLHLVGTRTSRRRNKPRRGTGRHKPFRAVAVSFACWSSRIFFLFSLREISYQWLEIHSLETCISSSSVSCFPGIISAASYLCGEKKLSLSFLLSSGLENLFSSIFSFYLFAGYLIRVMSFKIIFLTDVVGHF